MLFRCFSSMMWHRLKGSTDSSRMRGEECNRRGIARGGERIWAIYRLVEKGRETVLVNYVWECTHGGEREGGLCNSLFTAECKQRSMERLAIVVHRIHSRLVLRMAERESRLSIESRRSMENISCGSRLMALLIIYVNRSRAFEQTDSWTWHAREIAIRQFDLFP